MNGSFLPTKPTNAWPTLCLMMCQTQMTIPLEIGAVLAQSGDLTLRELSDATAWQKKNGGTIERALLATNAITEEVLTAALSQVCALPGVSRATLAASDADVVASLPPDERRRFRALPFALIGKCLKVATCDPRNPVLKKNLSAATGFEVELLVAPEPVLEDVIAAFEPVAPGAAAPATFPDRKGQTLRPGTGGPEAPFRRRLEATGHFPRFDSSCRHVKAVHFALCPHCGDVL